MTKKEKAAQVVAILKEHYPATCSLTAQKDYELLFATRLSAQCTDARVNQVTPILFSRFPSLEALAGAPLEEVRQEIHRHSGYLPRTGRTDLIRELQGLAASRPEHSALYEQVAVYVETCP